MDIYLPSLQMMLLINYFILEIASFPIVYFRRIIQSCKIFSWKGHERFKALQKYNTLKTFLYGTAPPLLSVSTTFLLNWGIRKVLFLSIILFLKGFVSYNHVNVHVQFVQYKWVNIAISKYQRVYVYLQIFWKKKLWYSIWNHFCVMINVQKYRILF